MADITITQTKSLIGGTKSQRESMRSLGLKRIGDTVTQPDRPEIRGMVQKVIHLVTVQEASDASGAEQ